MTWKVIEFLIYLKTVVYSVPTMLSLDNDITNTYSNYLASIAATIEESVKYSHKQFSDYLVNESCSTIFLQPTDKEEIANIIYPLPTLIKLLLAQIVYLIEQCFF